MATDRTSKRDSTVTAETGSLKPVTDAIDVNALQARREPAKQKRPQPRTEEKPRGQPAPRSERDTNAIRAERVRPEIQSPRSAHSASAETKTQRPERVDPPAARVSTSLDHIPEEVRKRFVQVKRNFFFPDGTRAFTDRGRQLTTLSENTEVIRSLVSIAQARGWERITVTGTDRFRKEAWFAAGLMGISVGGYSPTEVERERLGRAVGHRAEASAESSDRSGALSAHALSAGKKGKLWQGPKEEELLSGKLIEHGPAPYRHDSRAPMSYFIRIETRRGEREIWGVDLERAVRQSLTKVDIGDEVGLRAMYRETVTVKAEQHDSHGKVIGTMDVPRVRNHWIVEKRTFFEERARAARMVRDAAVEPQQAVKQYPELAGTYLNLRAAEMAAERIRDRQDQQKFVALVRGALADSVARGEALQPVRLRDQSARRPITLRRAQDREQAPVRG